MKRILMFLIGLILFSCGLLWMTIDRSSQAWGFLLFIFGLLVIARAEFLTQPGPGSKK
ncbi:hypothetical protein ABNN70_03670 [Sporolactobacillus sp. Y61]|uniref:Lipoprotein n=1 Tax=Sporolactobacillus sp. Y61 TaxID=3160863 RepID=A0AAU8IHC2_9BACL|nr:hypothetical protein [Sporolactobacillus sp. THM19-2]